MRAGAVLPAFSWITGPEGTSGAGGSGPRSAGTRVTRSSRPSGNQVGSTPVVRLSRASTRRRAAPLATSTIQSSQASSVVWVKATREPSGDQATSPRRGSSGRPVTGRSPPSATRTRCRPDR